MSERKSTKTRSNLCPNGDDLGAATALALAQKSFVNLQNAMHGMVEAMEGDRVLDARKLKETMDDLTKITIRIIDAQARLRETSIARGEGQLDLAEARSEILDRLARRRRCS